MKKTLFKTLFIAGGFFYVACLHAQGYKEVARIPNRLATQAAVVGGGYLYAVSNRCIVKYTLEGDSLAEWRETDAEAIIHMNSGFVEDGRLYCVNSNYPRIPMTSSIEIFDAQTLEHLSSVSLGIRYGSCTWMVRKGDSWYAFFAHYENYARQPGCDVSWSQLVRFDDEWREQEAWVLPAELIKRLRPCSLSGGILVDGRFYCTGHDAAECYVLELPERGSTLKWTATYPVPFPGQAISMDEQGNLWGIDRAGGFIIKAAFCK